MGETISASVWLMINEYTDNKYSFIYCQFDMSQIYCDYSHTFYIIFI